MRRYAAVQKARDADVIGILVGTLGVGELSPNADEVNTHCSYHVQSIVSSSHYPYSSDSEEGSKEKLYHKRRQAQSSETGELHGDRMFRPRRLP